jgi:hypothetical protein
MFLAYFPYSYASKKFKQTYTVCSATIPAQSMAWSWTLLCISSSTSSCTFFESVLNSYHLWYSSFLLSTSYVFMWLSRYCFTPSPWLSRYSDRLRVGRMRYHGSIPGRVKKFSLLHSRSSHPASYTKGIRGSFPRGKAARAWSWSLTSI